MGGSSAYPAAFGRAVRFAHDTFLQFRGLNPAATNVLVAWSVDMVANLPPQGELELPDPGAKNPVQNINVCFVKKC